MGYRIFSFCRNLFDNTALDEGVKMYLVNLIQPMFIVDALSQLSSYVYISLTHFVLQ